MAGGGQGAHLVFRLQLAQVYIMNHLHSHYHHILYVGHNSAPAITQRPLMWIEQPGQPLYAHCGIVWSYKQHTTRLEMIKLIIINTNANRTFCIMSFTPWLWIKTKIKHMYYTPQESHILTQCGEESELHPSTRPLDQPTLTYLPSCLTDQIWQTSNDHENQTINILQLTFEVNGRGLTYSILLQ